MFDRLISSSPAWSRGPTAWTRVDGVVGLTGQSLVSSPPDTEQSFTIMITDLERSTELWELYDRAMEQVVDGHNKVIALAVRRHHGWVLRLRGDGILAAF